MSEQPPLQVDQAPETQPQAEPAFPAPQHELAVAPVAPPEASFSAALGATPAPEPASAARDILLAPEPVLTSLLHGAKVGGFFALFMWGFGATTDGALAPAHFFLNAALFGGIEVLRRQSGDQLGPAVLRVFGASLAAMGGIIVTVESMRHSDKAVLPFGLLALVAGVALLLVGIRKQRREERIEKAPVAVLPPERRISRQELEARFERQAAEIAPRERRRLWALGGAVVTLLAATALPEVFGVADRIPDAVYGGALVAFFGGLISTIWLADHSARRDAERFGTRCPHCAQPLRGATLNTRRLKLLELAGQCPHCKTQVTEPTP